MTVEARPNYYNTGAAFVAADQRPTPVDQTSLIRRNDVMQAVGGVIDAYKVQQAALLDSVTGETVQGRGFLSDAGQVAERRKTSRLYLMYYTLIVGMVAGGLVLLAHGAGYLDAGGSFATWLALTGGLALLLGWKRHGDELVLTPESIALRVVDAHETVALYESETRRLAIEWEHDAEQRRQLAQEKAAEHGRQLAQLRVDELDARRKAIEAQRAQADPYEGRFRVVCGIESPQTLQDGVGRTEAALQVQSIDDAPTGDSSGTVGDSWQGALVQWVAALYEPGNMTTDGIIRQRAPWAARSSWLEADKAQAKRVCCEMYPKLIEPAPGGQWRLRREIFTTVDQVMQILTPRLS
jgi:hypothetical protein